MDNTNLRSWVLVNVEPALSFMLLNQKNRVTQHSLKEDNTTQSLTPTKYLLIILFLHLSETRLAD
jgi:hypothetical protein